MGFLSLFHLSVTPLPQEAQPCYICFRNVGMGSMAVFDQFGASIAPFVILLVSSDNFFNFFLILTVIFVCHPSIMGENQA